MIHVNWRKDVTSPEVSLESNTPTPGPECETLWVPVRMGFRQILLGIDSYCCVNERGQFALMAIPDFTLSMALATVPHEFPQRHVVLVQRIVEEKDMSYLVPVTLAPEQSSTLMEATNYLTGDQTTQWVKNHDWHRFVSEIRSSNTSLNDPSGRHPISRVSITDRASPNEPDQMTGPTEIIPGAPVFIYTDPFTERLQSKSDLVREIFVRQYLAEKNIDSVRSAVKTSPLLVNLDENSQFVDVINKAVVEIKLHMHSHPSWGDLFLNAEVTEFSSGPPLEFTFTPKGKEMSAHWPSRELGVAITNWGEPNIAQVTVHVPKFKEQSPKDSVTTPSVAIFKDSLGIHMLRSELFRFTRKVAALPSTPTGSTEPVVLDKMPTSQIPEIDWEPMSGKVSLQWWHTDVVAKKVLYLAAFSLYSHLVGHPQEVIYSLTPIGSDVAQVATLFDDLEAGAPYAFAIIRGDTGVRAIPVFQTGTFEVKPDGSLSATKRVFLKNWGMTRQGERIQSDQQILFFNNPIYSSILTSKDTDPKIYPLSAG